RSGSVADGGANALLLRITPVQILRLADCAVGEGCLFFPSKRIVDRFRALTVFIDGDFGLSERSIPLLCRALIERIADCFGKEVIDRIVDDRLAVLLAIANGGDIADGIVQIRGGVVPAVGVYGFCGGE